VSPLARVDTDCRPTANGHDLLVWVDGEHFMTLQIHRPTYHCLLAARLKGAVEEMCDLESAPSICEAVLQLPQREQNAG
jgi:hypothetical protein